MSAAKEIYELLLEMQQQSINPSFKWFHLEMKEAIKRLEDLREIALIDLLRDAHTQVTIPILGIPMPIAAPTVGPAPVHTTVSGPRIVTGFVKPIQASELRGDLADIFGQLTEEVKTDAIVVDQKSKAKKMVMKKTMENNNP